MYFHYFSVIGQKYQKCTLMQNLSKCLCYRPSNVTANTLQKLVYLILHEKFKLIHENT